MWQNITNVWQDIPVWFRVWLVFCLVAGVTSMIYTFQQCGVKALLLGDGATAAAVLGLCD